jgi:hypothetical protein
MKMMSLKVNGNYWERGRLARPRNIRLTEKITPRWQNMVKLSMWDEMTLPVNR